MCIFGRGVVPKYMDPFWSAKGPILGGGSFGDRRGSILDDRGGEARFVLGPILGFVIGVHFGGLYGPILGLTDERLASSRIDLSGICE